MSYKVVSPPMSVAKAEEFGKWLAKYKIEISGLSVWQIGASGRRYRDDAAMDTIKMAGGYAGAGAGGAVAGSAAASLGCGPILGVILAPIAPYLLVFDLVMIPVSLWQNYKLRKKDGSPMAAVVKNDPIVNTEINFGLTGVSAKRRKWTEYLIAIYGAHHTWHITGLAHPEQIALGASYAARTGGYPPAWSEQPRPERGSGKSKSSRRPTRRAQPASRNTGLRERMSDWL